MAALIIILIVTEVKMLQMANPRRIIKSGPCDFQVFQQEEIEVVITTHLQTAVLSKSALYKVVWSDFEHSHQLSD